MRGWLASLVQGRTLEIGLALALGYAAVTLAEATTSIGVSTLAQHVGRDPFGDEEAISGVLDLFAGPYYLNFSIGNTAIIYGQLLSAAIVLGLVALAAVYVVRRRDRALGVCPFCASRIPYESTHCAYCGSSVAPGEPPATI